MGSKMPKQKTVFLVLISLYFLTGFCFSLYPNSGNIDIVLLIDSSGSMKGNDPSNLRLQAASSFVDLANVGDRIALVDFSTNSKILTRLRLISKEKDKEEIKNHINQIGHQGKKTDILDALETALQLINSGSNETSKKSIILLTDGELDLPTSSRFFGNQEKGAREICDNYQKAGIGICSIAFTDEAGISLLDKFAEASKGKLYTAKRDTELFKVYTDIFVDLKKRYRSFQFSTKVDSGKPFQEEILIDRYFGEITFAISRSSSNVAIEIRNPEKKVVEKGILSNASVAEAPSYKIVRVNQPEKGNWILSIQGEGHVYGQVIGTTDFLLNLRTSKHYYGPREPIRIDAYLLWRNSKIDDADILDGTEFNLKVTCPNGEQDEIPLFDNGKGADQKARDGLYSLSYAGQSLEGEYVFYAEATKKNEFTRRTELRLDRGAVFKIIKTHVEKEVILGEKALLHLMANSSYAEDQVFIPRILTFNSKSESNPSAIEFPALEPQQITFQTGKGSMTHVILNTADLPCGIYEGQLKLEQTHVNEENIDTNSAQVKPTTINFKVKVVPEPLPPPPPPNPFFTIFIIIVSLMILVLVGLYFYNKSLPTFSGTLTWESEGSNQMFSLAGVRKGFFKRMGKGRCKITVGSATTADIHLFGEEIDKKHLLLRAERTGVGKTSIVLYPVTKKEILVNGESLLGRSRSLKHDDVIKIGNRQLRFENFSQGIDEDIPLERRYNLDGF